MILERIPAGAVATAMLCAPVVHGATRLDDVNEALSTVAAPYSHGKSFQLFGADIQAFALRQEYLEGSTSLSAPLSFSVQSNVGADSRTPADLVHELRRLSGLTWAQIANAFDVSTRALHHWASGKTVSADNHERLVQFVAAVQFADKGFADENRNMLLSIALPGQTYLDLLSSGEYAIFRELAGQGLGRPKFEGSLSADAATYNALAHWGKALENSSDADVSDITLLATPKLRRAKPRRK